MTRTSLASFVLTLSIISLILLEEVSSLDESPAPSGWISKRQSHSGDHLTINRRPTQFVAELQHSPSSRGSLILPANNQLQASNFHTSNHPLKLQTGSNVFDLVSLQHPSIEQQQQQQRFASNQTSNHASHPHQQEDNNRGLLSSRAIELALRQSSGDENVFHPTSTIDLFDHLNYDWPAFQSPAQVKPNTQDSTSPRPAQELQTGNQNQVLATNEPNNNIAQPEDSHLDSRTIDLNSKVPKDHTHLNVTNGGQNESSTRSLQRQESQQLSNQVIYEGPATVPPVESNYYFSASEKQAPVAERASNVWW